MSDAPDIWMPLRLFSESVVWPTESAIRAMILKKDTNGMDVCIRKLGRRVLINPKLFFDLIAKGKSYRIKNPHSRG
jgi:hypothetical protein